MSGDVEVKVGGDASELDKVLVEVQKKVTEAMAVVKEEIAKVNETFIKLGEGFLAVQGVLAGGKAFGEMISSTVKLNTESASLGKQFGLSATQASILKVAMDENFVTQDQFSAAGQRLLRTLNTNENAFKDLGVETRDAAGNFRPLADIMLDTNEALSEFKEGTDRGIEATKIYGKGWQEISPVLKVTREGMKEAAVTAEELNLVVTKESQAMTKEYRSAMEGVRATTEGLFNVLGQALMPELTELGKSFKENGAAANGFKGVLVALDAVFLDLKLVVVESWNVIAGFGEAIWTTLTTLNKGLEAFLQDPFSGNAIAVFKDGFKQLADDAKARVHEITQALVDEDAAFTKFAERMANPGTPTDAPKGEKTSAAGAQDNGTQLADQRRAVLEKMYAEDAKYIDQLREAQEQSYKAQEEEFAKAAGARIAIAEQEVALEEEAFGKGSPQYEAAQKHLVEIKRKAQEELQQMGEAFAKTDTETQLRAIADQQKALDEQLQKHEVSNAQFEALSIQLENRRTQIAEQGARDRLKLIDPTLDPVQYAQLAAQIEALEREHDQRISQIKQQAAQRDRQIWDQLNKEIESGFTQNITKLVEGTETFRQAMRSLLKDVLNAVIQMLAQWVTQHTLTMALNVIQSKIAALAQVQAQAGVAGASGTASMASAPPPLDYTAPAFGASMAADALGFASYIGAESGYDIPSNVNPRVQLHQEEMVLPRQYADVIRGMAEQGFGSRSSRGGGNPMTIAVKTFDSRSFERGLRKGGALEKTMRELHRRGVRG